MDLNGFESLVDDHEFGDADTEALTNQIRDVDRTAEQGCQSVSALVKSAQNLLLLLRSATSPRVSAHPVSEGQPVTAASPVSAAAIKAARAQFSDALVNVRESISGCKASRAELAKLIDGAGMDIGDDSEKTVLEDLEREAVEGNDRLASAISLLRNLLTEMAVLLDIGSDATE